MTDKQIIIDGVDVSGCEFLTKTVHCKAQMSILGTDTNKCKCFPNCHFKQLKRKEQECEELKKEIAFGNNGTLSDKIRAEVFKELNNENSQLKAENENWQKEYWKLEQGNDFLAEKNSKLKGCLTEIKEIAEKIQ